jgi:hypothetical protein
LKAVIHAIVIPITVQWFVKQISGEWRGRGSELRFSKKANISSAMKQWKFR